MICSKTDAKFIIEVRHHDIMVRQHYNQMPDNVRCAECGNPVRFGEASSMIYCAVCNSYFIEVI